MGSQLLLALLVVGAGCVPPQQHNPVDPIPDGDPNALVIGCGQAAQRVTVSGSTRLDPSCTYTRGFDITSSNTVLDCRGAHIELGAGESDRLGILIETPTSVPLTGVTVKNCVLSGFANNLRIRRAGFKELAQGAEYANTTAGILVENSHFYDSTASGIFVDGFVTGVTLRDIEVSGADAVGIYLEAGSKDNVIEDSRVHHNGFGDVTPEGVPITVGGTELRYESTGREGIAIDGSRNNIVRDNWIAANAAGAIFLYKNCGEDATTNPDGHWVRHYGATGNVITGNLISAEQNGVWIGSRAAENQYFMDCSDTPYIDGTARRVYLDPASGNTVRANNFQYVVNAIRIEDDNTTVDNNDIVSNSAGSQAVFVGTKERTAVLAQPVTGTVITGNRASITGNPTPYHWIWGHTATTFTGNLSGGAPASLTEGVQPTINPFLFAKRIWAP